MSKESGLRERKKRQMRERIGQEAVRLFLESGYDAVTVADVARAADVSEGTVFNYFPTKESLVFARMEGFEAELLDAVSRRQPGEAVLSSFARFFTESSPAIAANSSEAVVAGARIISQSATLRAREREIIETYTRSLASLIAAETTAAEDDVEPWIVANALMGVHRALLDRTRIEALSGHTGTELASSVAAQADHAFTRLRQGLADYAVRQPTVQSGQPAVDDPAAATKSE